MVNNGAKNVGIQISFGDPAFNSLAINSEVEWLDHTVVLFLSF